MTIDDQKQQFSFAYARAVAATAQISVTEPEVDDDSIDLIFLQRGGGGAVRSPRVEVQVKCTEVATLHANHLAYPLKLKNYDELRPVNVLVPRILIVVLVPALLNDWLNHTEQELALRHCGYWLSLRGQAPTANATNVTVHLPRANQFTVAGLQGIMQRIGAGLLP
jgi:hypothetical protein